MVPAESWMCVNVKWYRTQTIYSRAQLVGNLAHIWCFLVLKKEKNPKTYFLGPE